MSGLLEGLNGVTRLVKEPFAVVGDELFEDQVIDLGVVAP